MSHHHRRHNLGLTSTLLLIVFTFITLSYFKVNLRDVVNTPIVQSNLAFAWDLFVAAARKLPDIINTIAPPQ